MAEASINIMMLSIAWKYIAMLFSVLCFSFLYFLSNSLCFSSLKSRILLNIYAAMPVVIMIINAIISKMRLLSTFKKSGVSSNNIIVAGLNIKIIATHIEALWIFLVIAYLLFGLSCIGFISEIYIIICNRWTALFLTI